MIPSKIKRGATLRAAIEIDAPEEWPVLQGAAIECAFRSFGNRYAVGANLNSGMQRVDLVADTSGWPLGTGYLDVWIETAAGDRPIPWGENIPLIVIEGATK